MKLEDHSKEELLTICNNYKYIVKNLQDRLELITGCFDFGIGDGTNGACVDCYYNNQDRWLRCNAFADAYVKYQEGKKNG